MTEIRLPALLDEKMRERARLHPVEARARMRLNALSTAEMTLNEEDPPIRVRDMITLYGPQGFLGIFRVNALQAVGDGLRLAETEHGLCTLEDDVTPPGTVLQGRIGDVVNALLQWQSRPMWKLGTVESGVILAETEADGANLLETLLAVLAIDESLMIETDQRVLPWVLHLRKMPEETGCECRLNRNLDGVTVALDGSELCTRVTAVLPDGTSVTRDGDTVGVWGVVHRAVTLDENQDPETEIRKYLEEHKNPGVSVELEAVALSALTGEPLDRFSLGGLCRVALPDWHTVISERVIAMAYDDLFGAPGKVKLSLCSQTLDAAALLARLRAEQRRSGKQMFRFIRETKNGVEILAEEILLRATKTEMAELNGVLTEKISNVSVELDAANATLRLKANQEYVDQQFSATELLLDGANARIEANALRIDEVNEQISSANLAIDGANARIDAEAKRIDEANGEISSAKLAIDGANAKIEAEAKRIDEANGAISSAQLAIDGANAAITAEAKRASEAEGELTGKLTVASDEIKAEVKRATEKEGEMAASIQANADAIALKVSQTTFDELGSRVTKAESSITQHADEIAMRVKKGDIASEINQTPQSVKISASKIELSGYVTATDFSAEKGRFDSLVAGNTRAKNLAADGFTGDHMQLAGNATITGDLTIHGFDFDLHKHRIVDNQDGTFSIGNPTWTDVNSFKIADTKTYKDGVSAAEKSVTVKGSWSGGKYSAEASNGVHAAYTWIGSGTKTVTYNQDDHTYSISVPIMYSNDGHALVGSTGQTVTASTGTEAYDAGAKGVYVQKQSWSNPQKGWVRCEITLSNGITRGWSKEVPSNWM